MNFFTAISDLFWTVNVFYLAEIILASFNSIRKMIDLRDITISKIKEKLKKAKVEEVKEQKEE